ncbi:Stress responsive protein [Paraburkholderia unamae]|uniref:Dabb family protein n=1 Tax=Paraburkholderia unamae TaxID=219649 RepID=UPI001CAF62C1|nr:Dabb family protein [Paraburkholderia unamae]CAG9275169.1 Stress responsive protein [Paraburkholderia unamae]
MIKHIVMWNRKGDTQESKARLACSLKAAFEGLVRKIPGPLHMDVGVDMSRGNYACDMVLCSEFDSHKVLLAYAHHADHLRVKQKLGDVRAERYQVDYHAAPSAVRTAT